MTITAFQKIWLLVLLGLWAWLLFGGFIFGKEWPDGKRRMPRWTRMASSLTLVVAAWSWFFFAINSGWMQLALFTAIGMTFGFIGDLFMAQVIQIKEYVLGGIASFSVGHIAYIIGFVTFAESLNYNDPAKRWGTLLVWLIIGTVLWYLVVFRPAKERTFLHIASLPYALLLAATAAFATGLALQSSPFVLVAIGATLFLISDLILAAALFNQLHFHLIDDVVWLTYGPGQMLIVYGVILRLAFT